MNKPHCLFAQSRFLFDDVSHLIGDAFAFGGIVHKWQNDFAQTIAKCGKRRLGERLDLDLALHNVRVEQVKQVEWINHVGTQDANLFQVTLDDDARIESRHHRGSPNEERTHH